MFGEEKVCGWSPADAMRVPVIVASYSKLIQILDHEPMMGPGYVHCLAPETLIEAEVGLVPIAELRVGQLVLTHTGAYRPVRHVERRRFAGEVLCVRVASYGDVIRITGEHPVGIAHAGYRLVWVEARELGGGMFVAMPRTFQPDEIPASAFKMESDGWIGWTDAEEPHTTWDTLYEWNEILKPRGEPYEGDVYNLSIEGDESYALAAGMLVHNCCYLDIDCAPCRQTTVLHPTAAALDRWLNEGVRAAAAGEPRHSARERYLAALATIVSRP